MKSDAGEVQTDVGAEPGVTNLARQAVGLAERLEARGFSGLRAAEPQPERLAACFAHWYDMAQGYIKDPVQREEQLPLVKSWQEKASEPGTLLKSRSTALRLPAGVH